MSAKALTEMGVPRVSHIVTGFGGWKEAGFPIEPWAQREGQSKTGAKAEG